MSDADRVFSSLAEVFPADDYVLLREVRSTNGIREMDEVRIADAVAVQVTGGGPVSYYAIEIKVDPRDMALELARPWKSAAVGAFCEQMYFATPENWKRVLPSLAMLPRGVGLIAGSIVVRVADVRPVDPPSDGFVRSLWRASQRAGIVAASALPPAPLRAVVGVLGGQRFALACGHRTLAAQKAIVSVLPCWACAGGEPVDVEVLEQAIGDLEREDLERLARLIDARWAAA